ncbi:MAG: hypothetical protein ACE5MG_11340 [Candidatus Methylomirabilales bacterium]
MHEKTEEALVRRVDLVERENRRLRRAGAAALAALAAVVLTGHVFTAERVVEAERFVLLDPSGETRAVLAVAKGGSGLYLYDKKGKMRAGLVGGVADETGLSLYDVEGKGRARLALKADGSPALAFADKDEKTIWSAR